MRLPDPPASALDHAAQVARVERLIKTCSLLLIAGNILAAGIVLLWALSMPYTPEERLTSGLQILGCVVNIGLVLVIMAWKSRVAAVVLGGLGAMSLLTIIGMIPGALALTVTVQTFRWHRLQPPRSRIGRVD